MTITAVALFAGTFAVLFAPTLPAQDDSPAARALLGHEAASIHLAGSPPGPDEPAATTAERALLGRQSGVRLRLESDDRPGRDADSAVRALLGR